MVRFLIKVGFCFAWKVCCGSARGVENVLALGKAVGIVSKTVAEELQVKDGYEDNLFPFCWASKVLSMDFLVELRAN